MEMREAEAMDITWDGLSIVVWITSANHVDGNCESFRRLLYDRRVRKEREGGLL